MYRIENKSEAIQSLQSLLKVVGDPEIFVSPSGIFDDNTRHSVIELQRRLNVTPNGIVDLKTLGLIYKEYISVLRRAQMHRTAESNIIFPLFEGNNSAEMININHSLARLLDYYGHTHRLRLSSYYSTETALAVKLLREIYLMNSGDYIDEEFYRRMKMDLNSVIKSI